MKAILIVNYNTTSFVDKLILSINKFVDGARIIVFDNSDKTPFSCTKQNVEIIDNTNGQIIDFYQFIKKYPRSLLSSGRLNNWASAKHCYTVEKCLDIMGENFILIDSDVLLKKDISDLFNDEYIYASGIIRQENGIRRVCPYLCFINTKMCKENNVHFFDEKYMHGLCVTPQSDMYDTGAAFFINADKFPHQIINVDDYIVHFGHGSWIKPGYHYKMTKEEFFEQYKNCWITNEIHNSK